MDSLEKKNQLKKFEIDLTVDRGCSAEAMRAVISTVLFHRLFGSLTPSFNEAAGVTYPTVIDPETEALVTDRYRELSRKLRDSSISDQVVEIKFYNRKVKRPAWFAKSHNYCWESWRLHLNIASKSETGRNTSEFAIGNAQNSTRTASTKELHRVLIEIIQTVDLHKGHIPSITTADLSPFQYEVSIV